MTSSHPYASAAPVLKVDGSHVAELSRDLLRLDIEEDTAGLRTFVAHFHGLGPGSDGSSATMQYVDGRVLDFGSKLTVELGVPGEERLVFDGKVSAIEVTLLDGSFPTVSVYAEDALMGLRMTRRSRTYENTDDAGIASRIASDHGLTADVNAPGPTYPVVQQWNQSDLAFLRDRAHLVRAEVWVTGTTLHFCTRSNRRAPEVTLVHGNQLLDAQIRADLAHQRSSVVVTGFDLTGKEAIEESANVDAVQSEVAGGGSPGPRIVEDAFGAKQSARVREVATAAGEARAWAAAEMLRRSRRFVMLDGVTSGTSDLTVGSHVRVERVVATFRRRAVLRDVGAPLLRRHRRLPHPLPGRTSDVGGAMRPAFGHESAVNDGARSRLFGVYPALVSDIVDPDARGRVKVRFPWLPDDGGSVGSWAVLLSPYADDDQGLQTIPEVGSLVVVAFEAGDINRPYILGAAWNGQAVLPVAVEAANNKRLVKSRAGSRLEFDDTAGSPKVAITVAGDSSGAVHKIILDDAGDSVLIKSRNGALVEIAAGGGINITANTKVTITAPMVQVDAPMAQFSGVVKCETLIATTVVGTSYTPGAGNIW